MGAHWQIQPDRESDEGGALEPVGGGTTGGGCLNRQREGRPSRKGQPHSQGLQSRDLESVMELGAQQPLKAPVVALILWKMKVMEEGCNPPASVHTHHRILRIPLCLSHTGKRRLREA